MPVAQGGPAPARQAVAVGVAAALGLAAILFLVTQADRLIGGADLDVQIGDGIFRPGPATDYASDIAETGPLLLPDIADGDSDIWLNHTGDEPTSGWHVFAARPPTAPRDCFANWDTDAAEFVDTCDGTVYPADGAGLPQFPVAVDADGNLTIDLNSNPVVGDADEGS